MNKTTTLVTAGIALMVGSALAPAVVSASAHPSRLCLDDTSAALCESAAVVTATDTGASGQQVEARLLPSGRTDAKDHPNFGQITTAGRTDAKDHPNVGQITTAGRTDAKDHPNVGQITTAGRTDAKDHPNFGQITTAGRTDAKDHPNFGQITTAGPSIYLTATPQ